MSSKKKKITKTVRIREKFFKIITRKNLKFSEILDIALEKELADRGYITVELRKEEVIYE